MLRKLELAEEFRQIGDKDGARDLLRDLLLNGITDIHQHLSKAHESLASLPRVCGNGTMRRHEDLGPEAFDRIQRLQPIEAVAIVDI